MLVDPVTALVKVNDRYSVGASYFVHTWAGAETESAGGPTVQFTVPKGTKNVGVKITVSTAEYPVYTTAQSQYKIR